MKHKLKFLAIIFLALIIRIILQMLIGEDPLAGVLPYSALVNELGVPAIAGPMIFLSYFLLAFVFVKIQKNLSGTKIQKGLLYGIIFGALWFFGMIEGHLEVDASLIKELVFGLLETMPIIIMSLLLGIIFAENSKETIGSLLKKYNFNLVGCITFFYILGRYFTYIVIGVKSVYLDKVISIFFWCVGNGIIIGSMYYFLGYRISDKNYIKKALFFCFIIFGTDWVLFNLFAPLLFNISILDILFRPFFDIIFVFLGVIVYKYVFSKNLLSREHLN